MRWRLLYRRWRADLAADLWFAWQALRCHGLDRHDLTDPVRGIRRCRFCDARQIEPLT